jgi:hypothetical protein
MSKRLFSTMGLTWSLNPLGSAATTLTYMGIKIPSTGVAGTICDILEVMISGANVSSVVAGIFLVRSSTLSTGAPTALSNPNSDGPVFPAASPLTANSVIQTYITCATTQPTLSSAATDSKLNLGLNSFGGILRWNAAPTQQWQLAGLTAPGAESVLANVTAAGGASALVSAHIMYEPA